MNYQFHDFIGNVGVLIILGVYLMLQLEKITSSNFWFSALNLFGASMILYSLVYSFNLSSFVIECVWILISLIGILRHTHRYLLNRKKAQ